MLLRSLLVVFLAASVLVAGGVPASGHERTPPVAPGAVHPASAERVVPFPLAPPSNKQALPERSAFPWIAISFVAALLVVSRCRSRRAVALALALFLALFAFQSAIHSVHHLGHREARATCVIASAASHLAGIDTGTETADCTPSPSFEGVVLDVQSGPDVDPPVVQRGRAPPPAA